MSSDGWSAVWSYLFPTEVWEPVRGTMSSLFKISLLFFFLISFATLVIFFGDALHWMPGPMLWAILIVYIVAFLLVMMMAFYFSPLTIFGYEIFTTAPNTCVGQKTSLEGGLCYNNCKPGYHGVGQRCYADSMSVGVGTVIGLEPCPDNTDGQGDWTNLGLTCSRWKNHCVEWGTDLIGHWWTGCVETVGRLDHGGVCPGPQDFGSDFDGEYKKWKKAHDKPDPTYDKRTGKMETAVEANAKGDKTCADIAEVGTDKHTERVDGMCYKPCPADYPHRIPLMPYLCYKGGDLSYDRDPGDVPHMLRFFGKYPYDLF